LKRLIGEPGSFKVQFYKGLGSAFILNKTLHSGSKNLDLKELWGKFHI